MAAIVLIHGSTQSASCWDLVRPHLESAGHQVIAVELPADQPEFTATEFARIVAEQTPDDAVLVGHSASGILLPVVAQMRKVRTLVYLAAMIPAPGMTAREQFEREPEMFNPEWVKAGKEWRERADEFLFHDVILSQRSWAHSTLRPMRIDGMLRERLSADSLAPVPSLCIVCQRDRTLNPEWQARAWRAHGRGMFREMDAGHCPHISSPRHIASHIHLAADAERLDSAAIRERDWMLRGRMAPKHWTGEHAPHTDYDAFLAVPCPQRQMLFIAMTPENKAEIMRGQVQRWIGSNRDRLTADQMALMREAISLIVPRRYEELRTAEDEQQLRELIGRMYAYFTREDMAEAIAAHW